MATDCEWQRLSNPSTGRWAAPHRIYAEMKQALSEHTSDFLTRCSNPTKPSHRISLFYIKRWLAIYKWFQQAHLKSNKSNIGFWQQTSDTKHDSQISKQQIVIDTNGWNDAKHIKQISTTGGFMQTDCEKNGKSIRLCANATMKANRQRWNNKMAKKWRFKAVIHAQEGLLQIPPKMALRKGRFPKRHKNTHFLLFAAPNLRYFLFGGQLYAKAPTTA